MKKWLLSKIKWWFDTLELSQEVAAVNWKDLLILTTKHNNKKR